MPLNLDELKALYLKTTPGEWVAALNDSVEFHGTDISHKKTEELICKFPESTSPNLDHNAEFLVELYNSFPDLVNQAETIHSLANLHNITPRDLIDFAEWFRSESRNKEDYEMADFLIVLAGTLGEQK